MRAALIACAVALVGCGDEPTPVVGDAAVVDAWAHIDAPACDRAFFDAGPGRRCEGGEIVSCDTLVMPACDQWGCCPVIVTISAERDRCCLREVTFNPYVAPCCELETAEIPEACPRCEYGVPP